MFLISKKSFYNHFSIFQMFVTYRGRWNMLFLNAPVLVT